MLNLFVRIALFFLPFYCLPDIHDYVCRVGILVCLRSFIQSRILLSMRRIGLGLDNILPQSPCPRLCFKVAAWPWCSPSPLSRPTMELCMSWMLSQPTSRLNTNTAIISSFSGPGLASVKNQFLRAVNEARS